MESPNGSNYIHMCRWLRCPPVTSRATSTETGCTWDRAAIISGAEKNSHQRAVYTFYASADESRCLICLLLQKRVSCSRHDNMPQFVLVSNLTVRPVFRFPACYFCKTAGLFQRWRLPHPSPHLPNNPSSSLHSSSSSISPLPTTTTKLPLVARCHGSWLERTAPFSPARCLSMFAGRKQGGPRSGVNWKWKRGGIKKTTTPFGTAGGGGGHVLINRRRWCETNPNYPVTLSHLFVSPPCVSCRSDSQVDCTSHVFKDILLHLLYFNTTYLQTAPDWTKAWGLFFFSWITL